MVTGQEAQGCSAGMAPWGVAWLLWMDSDGRNMLLDAPAWLTGLFAQVPRRTISGVARSLATLTRVERCHSLQVIPTCRKC